MIMRIIILVDLFHDLFPNLIQSAEIKNMHMQYYNIINMYVYNILAITIVWVCCYKHKLS